MKTLVLADPDRTGPSGSAARSPVSRPRHSYCPASRRRWSPRIRTGPSGSPTRSAVSQPRRRRSPGSQRGWPPPTQTGPSESSARSLTSRRSSKHFRTSPSSESKPPAQGRPLLSTADLSAAIENAASKGCKTRCWLSGEFGISLVWPRWLGNLSRAVRCMRTPSPTAQGCGRRPPADQSRPQQPSGGDRVIWSDRRLRVPRWTLGSAGTAGQLLGASDVGVACVRWQRLRPPARWALAPADMDLPHRRSFRPLPGLEVRTSVSSLGLRMKIGRMSAHRSCSAGCHRPRRPAQTGHTGHTSGHLQVGRLVRRDAPAIGKQRAGVLKHHDAVAEQAPSLFGMRRHDVGRPAIRCVRGRTGRLMLAHDAPRSCCRR